ncbi:MAG: M16 family metallopeptidase [Desulfobacca sp.]|uniref:M16 family metallopeptidase n=1 Tax=Desulfobacca sp. TaxID=2067990 RepID=UPI00404B24EA
MTDRLDPKNWSPAIAVHEYQLANGLKLLVLPDGSLPIASFQVHYGVGSRNERQGITGISHLFEHMMFRGSKELGPEEFSRIIQAKGGEVNAFTTQDTTSYFENIPAEHLELVVRLEADRLKNLDLTPESFASEREVVRSERKLRAVDSPFGLPLELLFATAFTQHSYQWPVIGWDADLVAMTHADCLEYFRTYYNPANMVIVVAGAVVPERAKDLVEKYFGDIPGQEPPLVHTVEPPQRGERRAIFKKVSQVEAFLAGFHVPGLGDPEIYPIMLLAAALGMGKASRCYQKFVRPGRAIEVEVDLSPPPFTNQDPGLLVILGVASPGQPLAALETAVWEEIEMIKTKGLEEAELARVKKLLRSQTVRVLANNFYRGLLAGLLYLKTGRFDGINDLLANYERVTLDQVQAAARTYLSPDNRTVVVVQPVSPEENAALGPVC